MLPDPFAGRPWASPDRQRRSSSGTKFSSRHSSLPRTGRPPHLVTGRLNRGADAAGAGRDLGRAAGHGTAVRAAAESGAADHGRDLPQLQAPQGLTAESELALRGLHGSLLGFNLPYSTASIPGLRVLSPEALLKEIQTWPP